MALSSQFKDNAMKYWPLVVSVVLVAMSYATLSSEVTTKATNTEVQVLKSELAHNTAQDEKRDIVHKEILTEQTKQGTLLIKIAVSMGIDPD